MKHGTIPQKQKVESSVAPDHRALAARSKMIAAPVKDRMQRRHHNAHETNRSIC
jgi:hypothetical protein